MQSMKETASNIVASAKAGMEKTKATVQEKVEKMSTSDAMEKDRATHKKEDRINQAEMHKHEFQESNAAATHGAATGGDSSDFSSGTRHGAGGITSDYSSTGGYTAGSGGVGTGGAATTYGGRNDDLLTGGQSATKAGGYSTGDDYGITGGGAGIGSAGYSSGGTGMMGGNEYGTAGHHAGGGVGGLGSEYGSGERGGITDSEYGIGGKHTAAGGGIMDSEYGIGGTNTAAGYGRDSSTTVYDGMDSDEMRGTRRHGYETRGSNRKQGGGSDY